jgi:superfamily II DNA or RNA helicase
LGRYDCYDCLEGLPEHPWGVTPAVVPAPPQAVAGVPAEGAWPPDPGEYESWEKGSPPPKPLCGRPYQREAVAGVFTAFEQYDSTLLIQPTATGKTVAFSLLAAECRSRYESGRVVLPRDAWMGKKILVLAHRDELVRQAVRTLARGCPGERIDVEKGPVHASQTPWEKGGPRIVVASVQSICQEHRLRQFRPQDYGLVVCDEAHHATPKNATYNTIFVHFEGCKRLGVTASPDRSDEISLGQMFRSVAYHYPLWNIEGVGNAIDDGWVPVVVQRVVRIEGLDYSKVKSRFGDLAPGELERVLTEERKVQGMVDATIKIANEGGRRRRTLIFATSVFHARLVAEVINRHAEAAGERPWAAALSGEDDLEEVRVPTLEMFRRGTYQFLCNCSLFTEGWDCSEIDVVAVMRPTKSRALYGQAIGRGLRPLDGIVEALNAAPDARTRRMIIQNSAKPALTVLDFCGNAGKHKLVFTGDILGGQLCEAALLKARKAIEDKGEGDVQEELRKAREEEERERKVRRRQLIMEAKYKVQNVDPFDVLDMPVLRTAGYFQSTPPEPWMVEFLTTHGVKTKDLSRTEAKRLIDELKLRKENGLCTFKQVRLLRRYKYADVADWTFERAKEEIDRIKANGWRRPGRGGGHNRGKAGGGGSNGRTGSATPRPSRETPEGGSRDDGADQETRPVD